jgi:hypothetical protein
MPIRPEFLVRDLEGRPQPPDELVRRLKRYDDRIGLFYTNVSWAITERWRENDPRWERVREGELQPEFAFDICGYLPITCSVDEALPYIERELRVHTAESFNALRYAVNHWNDTEQDRHLENTVLGAVSNDLDNDNIVSPGISASVIADITPTGERMAKVRTAKEAKKGAVVEKTA